MTIQIELKTLGTTFVSTSDTGEPLIFHSAGESYFVEAGFLPTADGQVIPFFAMLDTSYLHPPEKVTGLEASRLDQLTKYLHTAEYVSLTTLEDCPDWLVLAQILNIGVSLDLKGLEIRNLLEVRATDSADTQKTRA